MCIHLCEIKHVTAPGELGKDVSRNLVKSKVGSQSELNYGQGILTQKNDHHSKRWSFSPITLFIVISSLTKR